MTSRFDLCATSCADTGQFCALVDVGCGDEPPCLLEAECRPHAECGPPDFSCPGSAASEILCADDPTDDCNMAGCPGLCICSQSGTCEDGFVFDLNPAVCECVPAAAVELGCIDITCPADFDCEIVMGSPVCVKPVQ